MICPDCKSEMRNLFFGNSFFCPNDCDREKTADPGNFVDIGFDYTDQVGGGRVSLPKTFSTQITSNWTKFDQDLNTEQIPQLYGLENLIRIDKANHSKMLTVHSPALRVAVNCGLQVLYAYLIYWTHHPAKLRINYSGPHSARQSQFPNVVSNKCHCANIWFNGAAQGNNTGLVLVGQRVFSI